MGLTMRSRCGFSRKDDITHPTPLAPLLASPTPPYPLPLAPLPSLALPYPALPPPPPPSQESIDGQNLTDIINSEHENVKYLPGIKFSLIP